MGEREYRFHNGKHGSALAVRITPRASRNEIAEILHDGTVRIRLTVPPVESQMNQALAEYLSKILEIPASKIDIVAGQNGRDKLVSVLDMDPGAAHQKIIQHLT